MATIRAYTTIEQSRKLAEILPLESADMYYQYVLPKSGKIKHNPETGNPINALEWYNKVYTVSGKDPIQLDEYCVPCWSLASLLSVLPSRLFDATPKRKELYLLPDLNKSYCFYRQFSVKTKGEIYLLTEGECLVDACYDMILNLHKLKLL